MNLLPCPFCGSVNIQENSTGVAEIYGHEYQTAYVECMSCGTCGPSIEFVDGKHNGGGYEELAKVWNIRFP